MSNRTDQRALSDMTAGAVVPVAPALSVLRQRTSIKWRTYPADVLPLFVAEMDFPLAPVVADAMTAQIHASDLGYVGDDGGVGAAFAGFAGRRWGWNVDPGDIHLTTDVSVAIVETLRVAIKPGDGVVITSPVYPPFFDLVTEAGGTVVDVALRHGEGRWSLDLDGIERAFRDGARAIVLCHPHNPMGLVHPHADLVRLADLAAQYGVTVVSDEIHAPLTHPDAEFVPFLSVSKAAQEVGVATHAASKAFNTAGAKCAIMVAAADRTRAMLARQPHKVLVRTGILGRTATVAAFTDGDPWLDATLAVITDRLALLEALLAQHLPSVVLHRPAASYLAWLDLRATGLGEDPAAVLLERGRVALNSGPQFGPPGTGFARLNFGCSAEVLTEAVERIAHVVHHT